jgi:hypothetical protein
MAEVICLSQHTMLRVRAVSAEADLDSVECLEEPMVSCVCNV